jgi:RimJ/RimL family protein N-acetyltransferase
MVLRPWTHHDSDVWHELLTNPAVLTHIGGGNRLSDDDIDERLAHAVENGKGPGIFACELLDTPGDVVGMVGFAPPTFLPELLPVQEIGWRFLPDHWGKGLATEAATAALSWAFENGLLDRAVACVQLENRRSAAVAAKLGMSATHRTVIPRCHRWVDVYELSGEDWQSQ